MNSEKGLKEQIKTGELSPDEAIKKVGNSKTPSDSFLQWADTHGRKRYAQALRNKESSETKPPKKKTK
jgi:hypothetical protein